MISHADTSQVQEIASQYKIIKTSKQEKWERRVQKLTVLLILFGVANMTAAPVPLFFWPCLTLPTSLTHHSIQKLARLQRRMTEGPLGFRPGPQNHTAPLTQLLKRLTGSFTKFGQIIWTLFAWKYSQHFYFKQWKPEVRSLMKQNSYSKFDKPNLSFSSG